MMANSVSFSVASPAGISAVLLTLLMVGLIALHIWACFSTILRGKVLWAIFVFFVFPFGALAWALFGRRRSILEAHRRTDWSAY